LLAAFPLVGAVGVKPLVKWHFLAFFSLAGAKSGLFCQHRRKRG
jgi:hypothetical protein